MYFPKLENIKKHDQMNAFVIKQFDEWLASKSEMYTDYLNPNLFIRECKINRKLGMLVFALSAAERYFPSDYPLLKVKYILDCPSCIEHFDTYYSLTDIPNCIVECDNESCDSFNPQNHPERTNVFFELLDSPEFSIEEELKIFEKNNVPNLTVADEDFGKCLLEMEEEKIQ